MPEDVVISHSSHFLVSIGLSSQPIFGDALQ